MGYRLGGGVFLSLASGGHRFSKKEPIIGIIDTKKENSLEIIYLGLTGVFI